MSKASLELGGGNWGTKDGNLLAYAQGNESSKFVPREFTFTRGSDIAATRVNSSGLIEKYRENLLLRSNDLDTNPFWVASATITGGQAGYDGTNDAWLLQATATGAKIYQSISLTGTQTFSFYAKAGTQQYLRVLYLDSPYTQRWYNLGDGSTSSGNSYIDDAVESVGNDWYRITLTANQTTTRVRVQIVDGMGSQACASGDNVYLMNFQLEQGLVATSYLESGATTATSGVADNEPRIDYTGGTASLLLEPSRTNLIPHSEYFDSWTKVGSPTITNNYGISPEGVQNSTRFEAISDRITYDLVTINANETFSIYMKGSGTLRMQVGDDNFYPSVTSEWVRYEFTTTQAGNRNVQIRGNGSAVDVELYGAQYERNSYPTSYIPTYGTSVTRGSEQDAFELELATFLNNVGTLGDATFMMETSIVGRSSDFIDLFSQGGSGNNTYNATTFGLRINGGAGLANFSDLPSILTILDSIKILIRKSGTTFNVFVNGTKSTSTQTIDVSATPIKWADHVSTYRNSQAVKQILKFPTTLTDDECIALTTL